MTSRPRMDHRRPTPNLIRSILIGALAASAVVLPACQKGGRADAMSLYQQGEYEHALREATKAHSQASGRDDRSALVAGMAARELGYESSAENWLRPLTKSSDREIAGRARATLGLQRVERGDFVGAAIDFSQAGSLLRGEEASRANFFAGECYRQFGRNNAARLMYRLARGVAQSEESQHRAGSRLRESDYSVQLGVFRSRENAQRVVSATSHRALRLGLGEPRIISSTDVAEGVLHLVHLGRFGSETEANAARVRMGTEAVVVSSVD